MEPSAKSFATQTGYCHILPDRVVLNQEPVYGEAIAPLKPWRGRPLYFPAVALTFALFVFGYLAFRGENQLAAMIAVVVGFLCARYVFRLTFRPQEFVIARDGIFEWKYMAGQPPITKAFFIVKYRSKRGSKRNKVVVLPSFTSRWQDVRDHAMEILREENLLTEN